MKISLRKYLFRRNYLSWLNDDCCELTLMTRFCLFLRGSRPELLIGESSFTLVGELYEKDLLNEIFLKSKFILVCMKIFKNSHYIDLRT